VAERGGRGVTAVLTADTDVQFYYKKRALEQKLQGSKYLNLNRKI
jgi:hypothetical protein